MQYLPFSNPSFRFSVGALMHKFPRLHFTLMFFNVVLMGMTNAMLPHCGEGIGGQGALSEAFSSCLIYAYTKQALQ